MTDGRGSASEWLAIYLKGMFMGAADTVPGVSGGTIALIVGIYDRLVGAIAALDPTILRDVPRVRDAAGRADLKRRVAAMDIPFLLVLGAGIVTAVVTLARLLAVALERYPAPMNAFFFGLIAASAVVLYREVSIDSPHRLALALAAAAFAFVLTGATAAGAFPHTLLVIFLAGAITSSAMLLPGISGAALLYILGQYEYMIATLEAFTAALVALLGGGRLADAVGPGLRVAVFVSGVGLGLLTISHLIRWALDTSRATTLAVLVSLMVGSLRLPAAQVLAATPQWTPATVISVLAAAAVGAGAVLALDRFTDDLDYAEATGT